MLRILVLLITVTGCSDRLESQVTALVNGKKLWKSEFADQGYSFEYMQLCFCPNNNKEIIISVRNMKVVSAETKNGDALDIRYFKSIEQQFGHVFALLEKQMNEPGISINIEFDRALGFPTLIEYRNRNWIDADYRIEISNVKRHGGKGDV